jgi:hypothetical protein
MKPPLKAPETKRLKLKYDEPLSNFAFKFDLRRFMKGWLAAMRAMRATRRQGDTRAGLSSSSGLSSDDTDTERSSSTRTWGTPVLHIPSQRLLIDWLARAREILAARVSNARLRRTFAEIPHGDTAAQRRALIVSSSDDTSSGDGGSDDGGRPAMVHVQPASGRIMRHWLAAVRARRAARLGRGMDPLDRDPAIMQQQRRMQRAQRAAISSSSDSDGGDSPGGGNGGAFDASMPVSVTASSQRVVLWWLQQRRRLRAGAYTRSL